MKNDLSLEQREKQEAPQQVCLRLILVSGQTHEFTFSPPSSATDVCQYIYANWPQDWGERVASPTLLKLIYHGRFLHGTVTLNALNLPTGKTIVMHLVTRENLPEPSSNEDTKRRKQTSCCRCTII